MVPETQVPTDKYRIHYNCLQLFRQQRYCIQIFDQVFNFVRHRISPLGAGNKKLSGCPD